MKKITSKTQIRKRMAGMKKVFQTYCDLRDLDAVERRQGYIFADMLADMMHYADHKGFHAEALADSAVNYFHEEKGARK